MPQPPEHPWDRLPGENANWFARFQFYLRMPLPRSLVGCLNQERAQKGLERKNTLPGSWARNVVKFNWKARAEAWDLYEHQRWVAQQRRQAKRWREDLGDKVWELKDRVDEMLAVPIGSEELKFKWTNRDIPAFMDCANKLAAIAFGIDEEKVDELKALQVLVDSGWIPQRVLLEAAKGMEELRTKMQQSFEEPDGTTADS